MSKVLILSLVFAGVWWILNYIGLTSTVGSLFGFGVSISALIALTVCILFASKIK